MTEKQLIKDCQKGVKSSQYELVKRYSAMLMSVSRRYVRDEAAAKDVLQESLIKIFGNIDKYKPIGSFEGWMRTITTRCALSWLRKNSKLMNSIEEEHIKEEGQVPDIYMKLDADDILEIIEELPEGYRTVFNLYVIEGYSHREVSEMLNISEGASRSQLTRAKKALKEKLSTSYFQRKYNTA